MSNVFICLRWLAELKVNIFYTQNPSDGSMRKLSNPSLGQIQIPFSVHVHFSRDGHDKHNSEKEFYSVYVFRKQVSGLLLHFNFYPLQSKLFNDKQKVNFTPTPFSGCQHFFFFTWVPCDSYSVEGKMANFSWGDEQDVKKKINK